MGDRYEARPSVELEKVETAVSLDDDSEIMVEKQDSEARTQHVSEEGDAEEERDVPFPPKVDSEEVVLKEGVCKQVIKEGHGLGPPSRHSSCFGSHASHFVFFSSFCC